MYSKKSALHKMHYGKRPKITQTMEFNYNSFSFLFKISSFIHLMILNLFEELFNIFDCPADNRVLTRNVLACWLKLLGQHFIATQNFLFPIDGYTMYLTRNGPSRCTVILLLKCFYYKRPKA